MKNQVKIGAILSYILIILNSLYGLFISPFLLGVVGQSEYGVYKTMSSLTTSLLVLDLGIGGTALRYIAQYRASGEDRKIDSICTMLFFITLILAIIVGLISFGVFFCIEGIYKKSFSENELFLAKRLFIILSAGICMHIFENLLNGIITGFNDFIFANGIKILRLFFRIIFIYIFFSYENNILYLTLFDLVLTIILIIIETIWCIFRYKISYRFNFGNWNKNLLKEMLSYTVWMFLTTIASQINNNIDNIVIGAFMGATYVAVYSFGLTIFSMYEQFSTAISGVMLPTVANILKNNNNDIQNFIIKIGRVQFIFLGAVVVGFLILGQEFLNLWLGEGYESVYIITLILMIPSLFELCVNVCLSVLRVHNKLRFRTLVLSGTTLLNLIITIFGVMQFGYVAAAIGTALSFIIGSLIIMNIYYYKVLGFNMIKIYVNIIKKIWICLLISGIVVFFTSKHLKGSWLMFVCNVVIFCIIYIITLLLYGLTKQEKNMILRKKGI